MTERDRETEELGIRHRIAFLNEQIAKQPERTATSPDFEIDVTWLNGDDALVTVYYGETEEGAPIPVHAEYESTGSLETTLESFVDKILNLLADGFELASIVQDDFQSQYDARVAAGWGSWLAGDRVVSIALGEGAKIQMISSSTSNRTFEPIDQSDAYEPRDPKRPDYLERMLGL